MPTSSNHIVDDVNVNPVRDILFFDPERDNVNDTFNENLLFDYIKILSDNQKLLHDTQVDSKALSLYYSYKVK